MTNVAFGPKMNLLDDVSSSAEEWPEAMPQAPATGAIDLLEDCSDSSDDSLDNGGQQPEDVVAPLGSESVEVPLEPGGVLAIPAPGALKVPPSARAKVFANKAFTGSGAHPPGVI